MSLIHNADYFVRYVKMPHGFTGFVTPNDDGTYSIYIDPTTPQEVQLHTYDHEVWHLLHDDFDAAADPVEAENRLA